MRHIRVGDRVSMIYQMNNCGIVTEVFFKRVTAGTSSGSLSKQTWIKFKSDLTGKIVEIKREDVIKES